MHAELPFGAITAALLVLVPLPWHWRARNVPTLSIIAWLFISNLIFAVNSIVWSENVNLTIPVWCDIVTKIQIGATMALPACCLCLCIHLERIASTRIVQTTSGQRRRRMIFDGLMCWGLPIVYMALHYIVQGHRFDIVEDLGCRPAIYTSVESILIIWTLPLLVVTLTFIYASLALRHFFQRRITFARHLQNSNSALTTSRYFRLISMAIVQMFWGAFMMIINVWFTCRNGLRPWTGWADVHSNFSRVAVFPARLIPPYILGWTLFTWWTVPISSVLFFVFFSFGEDAMKEYRACINWVARVVFRRKDSSSKSSILPSFIRPSIPKLNIKTSLPVWKKSSDSPSSPSTTLPVYSPNVSKKQLGTDTLSSSLAGDDHELDVYTTYKSTGLPSSTSTSPPEYYHARYDHAPPLKSFSSPQSSKTCLQSKPSNHSLRTADSRDRIYVSDIFHESPLARTRTPSPAPFADIVVPPYHRPFTPPNAYPATLPHPGSQSLDVIHVTIHTQSQSTDGL